MPALSRSHREGGYRALPPRRRQHGQFLRGVARLGPSALRSLETSLKFDPETPAQYLLAYAHAQKRHDEEARAILETIPRADLQYDNAQQPLNAIAGHH